MHYKHLFLLLLRVSLGWLFFYAGITKVLDPSWTSAGYLAGAKTFSGFYQFLASPHIIPFIDFINQWGLTLLGVSLLLGVGVRWSSVLGALLMLMYYFPILEFPYIGTHSYIVDEHIVYALALLLLASSKAGYAWGLEGKIPYLKRVFR